MSQFSPNGIVDLISGVPWHSDYADVRYFTNQTEQIAYFNSKPSRTFTNCSYTRGSQQFVAVDENIENLWKYDYMRYQNDNMGTKWFYAFIDHLEYRAAKTTYVYFTIDVFQTWLFDFSSLQCLIEREHPGIQAQGDKYYVPEGLDYGEEYYTVYEAQLDLASVNGELTALLMTTIDLEKDFGTYEEPSLNGATGVYLNNLPSGCNFYVINASKYGDASLTDVFTALSEYPWACKGIIGLTLIPDYMLDNFSINQISIGSTAYFIGQIVDSPINAVEQLVFNENVFQFFGNVTNQKLLMYPYAYLELTLQNGSSLIIKPQYMNDTNISVSRKCVVANQPEVKYTVEGYRGEGDGYNFSLTMKDFPQLPVLDNSYLLTQNYTQEAIRQGEIFNFGHSALGVLGSILSLNAIGISSTVMSGVEQAYNLERQSGLAATMTPSMATQAGGSAFNMATNQCCLTLRWKQIAPKYREILGQFFNKYGLKVNRVGTPDVTRMSRFDYLKCVDYQLEGDMPMDDQNTIIQAINRGVTFWHDDNIGNYDNNIGVKRVS